MLRHLLLTLVCALVSSWGYTQTTINGKITDEDTGDELIGANVVLYKAGTYRFGASTDYNGNYRMNVDPGTYDMEVTYLGYSTSKISGVLINSGQENKVDATLGGGGEEAIDIPVVVFKSYRKPLIHQGRTSTGAIISSKEIRQLSTKNVTALATQTAGASAVDEGDEVTIKGSRSAGTNYYIDDIRVSGAGGLIPESEIEQIHVITGGIDAKYGDVTGGIISITTKGPSNKYSGGLELETSEYLDQFGYNMINGNISGPILKKKNGASLLGFRFSGRYRSLKDNDPPAPDIFQIKEEVLAELEANPIVSFGTSGQVPAGQFITNDDINILGYQPNEEEERLDLTGKIEGRIGNNIDLTLSGSYSNRRDRFTPREDRQTGINWRVFNSHNNPYQNNIRYRGNFRLRHRLGNNSLYSKPGKDKVEESSSLFSNVEYTIIGGYEKSLYNRGDHRHGENYFDYGYIGKFDYRWDPAFDFVPVDGRTGVQHVDYTQNFIGFTPGTQNPVLANYNNGAEPGDINTFVATNEAFSFASDEIWDNHANVGQVYNLYQKTDNDLLTLNVSSNFDLSPGGSDKGIHSIQFGILFEQRINRGFDIQPGELWQIARQQTNRNILGIDPTDTIGWQQLDPPYSNIQDSVAIHPIIAVNQPGLNFANSIRELLGRRNDQYVNVHGVSPDQLSLGMFSAQELNDQYRLLDLNYYGFSYTGEKLSTKVSFDDFFTSTVSDSDDTRTFPVAAVRPNYSAAYIQDRFTYKDIIFRLGLRVDRYDANTKVLKDPYSLYEVMRAEDFHPDTGQPRPDGVEDDFRVYVADPDSDIVVGYRRGDQWYDNEGAPVNDGRLIFGGGVVTPKLYEERVNNIQDRGFDPNNSFRDYEPQINWMPRLAFSFPISNVANFFAHYDILVQRPSALGVNIDRATALDYFYWERDANARRPNANLKPQRTIDYEVGFQQRLTNSSAIKLAVYYKEMRDMIQGRNYLFIPGISSYETYGNLDFGTSKGFTLQYDLRRTRNVTFNASYSLQFADGTGSDADGRRGITNRGVIRTLFPLNFDERHRLIATLDYRYSSGKEYNGPTINGKDVLENFGLNLNTIAVSGRPYTAKQQSKPLDADGTKGQVNGARLPWNYTINLKADKTFRLSKPNAKTPLSVNVYFRIQNLLNTRNIVNVYPLTGAPGDDGYLNSPAGIQRQEDVQNSGLNLQSYLDAYQWRVLNPNFFSLPRRMYMGAILEF